MWPGLALLAVAASPDAGAQLQIEVRTLGTRAPIPVAQLDFADGGFAGETDLDGKLTLDVPAGDTALTVRAAGHVARAFVETLAPDQRLEVIYRLEPSGVRAYETRVVGNRFRTEVARAALSAPEVHEIAGTQGEPLRVILLLPGVGSVASGLSYPVVRGAQPAATAFFIDDVRVPQLFHALVGPSVVHSSLIDHLDFFSAAPPARFGRLMSGAVEAHVGRPRPSGFGAQLSIDLLSASGMVEAGLPTGTAITLAGRYSYTALVGVAIARALLPSDPPRTPVANFWDYQVRVEQRVASGRLRLLVLGASDEIGATTTAPNFPSGFFLSTFHRADLRWTSPFAGGELELGATWGPEKMGVQGEEGGKRAFAFLLSRTMAGGRVRYRAQLDDAWQLELGADLEWQRAQVELIGQTDEAPVPVTDFRDPLTSGLLGAVFASVGYQRDGVRATLGLRAELYTLDPDVSLTAFAPRLELRRAISEHADVRLSGGFVDQPPTILLNLPVTDLAGLRHGLQFGFQAEAGITFRPRESWSVDLAGFSNTLFRSVEYGLEQLLDARRSLATDTPGVPGRSYGVELSVRKEPSGRWFGWLSGTLMRSERLQTVYAFDPAGEVLGAPTKQWVPFAFDQTLILNATFGLRLPWGVQVGATVHFHTGRPESGQITSRALTLGIDADTHRPTWVPTALSDVPRLPPFFRLDLRVSKLWNFDAFQLEGYLDVLNASFSREVLGYQYGITAEGVLRRVPLDVPLILPQLGLKATY